MSKESWLERAAIRKEIMDTQPPYMRGLNRRKKKGTSRKKKSVQSSQSIKVLPTVILHRPEPIVRDAFTRLRDTLPDLIIESAAEINTPGYIRPMWMTDKLFDTITAAAIDQIAKNRAFDPTGLFGAYPTYFNQGAT